MTMGGGMRMPSALEVVITPAPKRFGKPCATIAGKMIEPATTVAGLEPDTAAKCAQAITPNAETAVPMANHRGSEIDHPLRDPTVSEKIAGEDEKRDHHDLEVLDAGEELQAHGLDRHAPIVIPGAEVAHLRHGRGSGVARHQARSRVMDLKPNSAVHTCAT